MFAFEIAIVFIANFLELFLCKNVLIIPFVLIFTEIIELTNLTLSFLNSILIS